MDGTHASTLAELPAVSDDTTRASAVRSAVAAMIVLAVVMGGVYPIYLTTLDRMDIVRYISDDAYYYFNVARHVAAGDGPTADGVTMTTGFHPLYGFLLAGMHWLLSPSLDGFVSIAILTNGACYLVAGLVLYQAGALLWGRLAGMAAGLLWLINPHASLIAATGLEGAVYSLALALLVWRLAVVLNSEGGQSSAAGRGWIGQSIWLGACGGLVLLSRTDALAVMPFVVLILLTVRPGMKPGIRAAGIALTVVVSSALLGLWWWYAYKHTGTIVQGSAAIKTLWHDSKVAQAFGHNTLLTAAAYALFVWGKYLLKCFLKAVPFKWIMSMLPGVFRPADGSVSWARWAFVHTLWVFPAGVGLAYGLFIDRPRTWYYVPAVLCLTLLSAGAVQCLLVEQPRNRLWALGRRTLPLLAWLVVIECAAIFGRDAIYGRSPEQVMGVLGSRWLADAVPTDLRVGCWHSGIVQYYTPEHTVINLDGLANNEILPVLRGEQTMNEYWDARNIRVILSEPRVKMGSFKQAWDGKRLVEWDDPRLDKRGVLVQRVVDVDPSRHR